MQLVGRSLHQQLLARSAHGRHLRNAGNLAQLGPQHLLLELPDRLQHFAPFVRAFAHRHGLSFGRHQHVLKNPTGARRLGPHLHAGGFGQPRAHAFDAARDLGTPRGRRSLLAFVIGCAAVTIGVLMHLPMFMMGASMHYRLVGMPMGSDMVFGMALIVGGVLVAVVTEALWPSG